MARQTPSTNIYRRVSCRIWADERFRSLSAPVPNAQTLWFALLFGEQTSIVPGLFRVGEAAFAEQLGWGLKSFRSKFAEVSAQGMAKADWISRLVWVPNAIRYNPPASPNVVRHWGIEWHLLPECALRQEAQAAMEVSLKDMGEAFRQAFAEVLAGVMLKDYGESEAVTGSVTGSGSPLKPPSRGATHSHPFRGGKAIQPEQPLWQRQGASSPEEYERWLAGEAK